MARDEETACPTCSGVGRDLSGGQLVDCSDCGGRGRVPAVRIYDYVGAELDGKERWPSFLEPIPKEYRNESDQ